jgi:autophagy-related protein 9
MQSDKSNSGTLWEQLGELEEDDRNVPGPSAAYGTARAPETPSGQMSSTHSPERIGTSHSTPTSRTSGAIAMALNCAKDAYSITPMAAPRVNTETGYESILQNDAEDVIGEETGMLEKNNAVWEKFGGNLDVFYRDCYEFYKEKGAVTFLCSKVTNLFTLFFTIAVTAFAFLWVDWTSLKTNCDNKENCNNRSFVVEDPFANVDDLGGFVVVSMFVVFSLYFSYCLFIFLVYDLWKIRRMKHFFRDNLKISPSELQSMSWDSVVERMQALHLSGHKVEVHETPPTAHDIAMRIMRYDNIFIALVNQGLFDLELNCCCVSHKVYLGTMLEWSLDWFLIKRVFDENFHVKEDWRNKSVWVRWTIQAVAFINIPLIPFIALFQLVYFVLNVAHEFHQRSSQSPLATCKWTPLARWRFREYNELQHVFDKRIARSIKPGMLYRQQYHNPCLVVLARCISFVAGGIIGVIMIAIYLAGDDVLTIHVWEVFETELSVLQLLTICGIVLGSARSYIPAPTTSTIEGDAVEDPNKLLADVKKHTHNMDLNWTNRGHTPEVYATFCSMFKSPIDCFVDDLLSTLLTPYILWFRIAPQSSVIVDAVCKLTVRDPRLGDICGPSTFRPRGDLNKSQVFHVAPSTMEEGGQTVEAPGRIMESWAALPGNTALADLAASWEDPGDKMQQSFVNFLQQHGRSAKEGGT